MQVVKFLVGSESWVNQNFIQPIERILGMNGQRPRSYSRPVVRQTTTRVNYRGDGYVALHSGDDRTWLILLFMLFPTLVSVGLWVPAAGW